MARMYHPKTGAEIDWVPDHPDTIGVFEQSGWKIAPEPEPAEVGRAPEPVTYEPVTKPAGPVERPTADALRAEWANYVDYLGGDSEGLTIAELKAKADELEGD